MTRTQAILRSTTYGGLVAAEAPGCQLVVNRVLVFAKTPVSPFLLQQYQLLSHNRLSRHGQFVRMDECNERGAAGQMRQGQGLCMLVA